MYSLKTIKIIFCFSLLSLSAFSAHQQPTLPKQKWNFSSITGTFPRDSLQRGFQVFKEVCSTCHSLKRVAYRNLKALGYNDDQVKFIASQYQVTDGPNQEGQMFQRTALASDHFVGPYPNDNAARAANNGALPPDLSLIIKARPGGADYVYALLTGYTTPPKGMVMGNNQYYNQFFPHHMISMAPPLKEGLVNYNDGTKATVQQMAHDVTTFLAWASEPEMEDRKQLGVQVMLYLFVMTIVFYFTKRRIWKNVKS